MVIFITGASHTGKTALAQKLLRRYHYPYLSIDHLKMGLIRSGCTELTPFSDDRLLTGYLWPIVREMVKTVIENRQNLVIEGCYIPFNWAESFGQEYLTEIQFYCLVMSRRYIERHFDNIRKFANVIENRLDDGSCTRKALLRDNARMLEECVRHGVNYILIDREYPEDMEERINFHRESMKENMDMDTYKIIRLIDKPELKAQAAQWFHEKWNIPLAAYMESMEECLTGNKPVPQWYVAMEENRIIGGLGVIENDFHDRKDLAPNVCAVYTEKDRRGKGVAGALLNYVCADMKEKGIGTLYLVTDHTSFYERYGWEFLCMVQGDGEPDRTRMYIHRG